MGFLLKLLRRKPKRTLPLKLPANPSVPVDMLAYARMLRRRERA